MFGTFLRELLQDVRYSVRVYSRRPFVTALTLLALALAIGATTGVFSVVSALLLRSLPFPEGDRLVQFEGYRPKDTASPAAFEHWRAGSRYVEDAIIFNTARMTLGRDSGAIRVAVAETTANFFSMLGPPLRLGREFASGEDGPGKNAVAVIGYALWQRAFGADVHAVGGTMRVNGLPLTIVGVATAGFDFPERTEVWTPTVFEFERLPKSGVTIYRTVGRLKPGMKLRAAEARFEAEVAARSPELLKPRKIGNYTRVRPRLVPLREQLAGPARQASLVLLGAVAFVLLVACANVANLFLTRITERRQELTVRAALGASGIRLVRQLMTESVVLALAASACGLVVAAWASRLAATAQPVQIEAQKYAVLDWTVVGFAGAVAVFTGVVFGVLPALVVARLHPAADLVRSRSGGAGTGGRRVREALIAAQVALTLMLVAASIATGRAFVALIRSDLGFRTDGVVTAAVDLTGTRYDGSKPAIQYCTDVLGRLRHTPDVLSAAAVDALPLATTGLPMTSYAIEGGGPAPLATVVAASDDYFRTLGTRVIAGREFGASDIGAPEPVAIVNEEFASASGLRDSIVGRSITAGWGGRPRRVVGVVRGLQYVPGYRGGEQVFVPYDRMLNGSVMFVARVRAGASGQVAACRTAIQSVDRQVGVFDAMTLDDRLADKLAAPRFYATIVLFFAAFTLLLAVIGIYGAATYSIAQRTHELGVRLALGGTPAGLRRLACAQSLAPVALGLALGVAGSVGLGGLLAHLVQDTGRIGIGAWAAGLVILALVALLVVLLATQRILRVNAMEVLRES